MAWVWKMLLRNFSSPGSLKDRKRIAKKDDHPFSISFLSFAIPSFSILLKFSAQFIYKLTFNKNPSETLWKWASLCAFGSIDAKRSFCNRPLTSIPGSFAPSVIPTHTDGTIAEAYASCIEESIDIIITLFRR